jgi:hypothetical protein
MARPASDLNIDQDPGTALWETHRKQLTVVLEPVEGESRIFADLDEVAVGIGLRVQSAHQVDSYGVSCFRQIRMRPATPTVYICRLPYNGQLG